MTRSIDIRMRHAALALLLVAAPLPAIAQRAPSLDVRVDRVEKELKAVQRKVFPGGAPSYFEPEIAPPAAAPAAGQPASVPLNDLTARLDALEREVARLTGQVEQDEHRLGLLSSQAAQDRAGFDARLKALETAAAPVADPSAPTMGDEFAPRPARGAPPPPIKGAKPVKPDPVAAKPARPVASDDVAAPTTATTSGDPAEDGYMAGYRLWTAKKYPEAEAALKQVVAKYPKHRRASYAQNLLGRALLDDDHPANAAEAFAANYQTNPRGERAPDSLYYLGVALTKLNKPADACKVYDEFDAAYAATAEAGLKARVATGRTAAKCK